MTTIAPPSRRRPVGPAPLQPPAAETWHRWRTPLVVLAVILLGGIVVALLAPATPVIGYLDPADTGPTGTRALADILVGQGTDLVRVSTPGAAIAAASSGASAIVLTSSELLTQGQLDSLAQARASLVIVEPVPRALAALAPAVTWVANLGIGPIEPGCRLAAAQLAGNADMGGTGLRLRPGFPGASCYRIGGVASLVQYSAAGRDITILGTGAPLQNQNLASLGNAALALNLLGHRGHVAWLVPEENLTSGPGGGPRSIWSLIPVGVYLVAAQLGIALLLTAMWRARRLGPLVTEQLPVVVRASETAEGHGKLYQARRARAQAAAALREATLSRLSPSLGLPLAATPDAVIAALAPRSPVAAAELQRLLFGPAPENDAALVKLAEDLDAMEREAQAP